MNALDNLNDLILYDFTDVLDRMHLPFPLTTRYLHPEVSHKNNKNNYNFFNLYHYYFKLLGLHKPQRLRCSLEYRLELKTTPNNDSYPNYKIHQFYTRI